VGDRHQSPGSDPQFGQLIDIGKSFLPVSAQDPTHRRTIVLDPACDQQFHASRRRTFGSSSEGAHPLILCNALMMLNRYPRWTMTGAAVSRTADEMSGTAMLLFAFSTTCGNSAAQAAVVFGSLTISAAAGGPLLGVWLDRAKNGRPLAVALAGYGIGLALCALLLHAGYLSAAVAVAILAGLLGPAVAGGWSAVLVHPDPALARRIVSFDASSYSAAGLIGPALAGIAYVTIDPIAPLMITMILLAAGVGCAARVSVEPRDQVPHHPVTELLQGTRAIWADRTLRGATLATCIAFIAYGLMTVAVPLIGEQRFGNPGYGTVLLVVLAIAALVSNAIVAKRDSLDRPVRTLAISLVCGAAGLAIAAIPSPATVLIGAVLIGIGDGPGLASLIQIRHDHAPARLRSQVFTTSASLKISAAGLGAYLARLIGHGDPAVLLVVATTVQLVAVVVLLGCLRGPAMPRNGCERPPD
jgi:MFS family permease